MEKIWAPLRLIFAKIKNQKWSKININTKLKNKKIKKFKARL